MAEAAAAAHGGGGEHHSHMATYWRVIIMLTVLTAAEFAIAFAVAPADDGTPSSYFMIGVLGLLALAAWKAVLVAQVFMHLKYDPRILGVIAVSPVVLSAPMILFCVWDGIKGPGF